MRKTGLLTLFTVALLLAGTPDAKAQLAVGPRVGYGTDFDLSIGAMGTYNFGTQLFDSTGPLHGALTVDVFFPGCPNGVSCSFVEVVPTVFVPIQNFFAGAGLDFARYSVDVDTGFGDYGGSSTDVGLALQGGYMFELGPGTGVADARFGLAGSEQLTIAFTYLFNLGGSGE